MSRRQGLIEALNAYASGKNVVLVAPTGYGKTLLSLRLLEESLEKNISSGLVHVAPYRALVREIFAEKFKRYFEDSGWQMHGELVAEDKSPYYLRKLIVTTLDSFIYNLYRLPIAEMRKIIHGASQGHYYPVLASIFTSTVVFDEAHSYLGDEEGLEDESIKALQVAVEFLSLVKVPVVVETATMSSELISTIVNLLKTGGKDAKVVYVGSAQKDQLSRLGRVVEYINDEEFTQSQSFNWVTKIVKEQEAFEKTVEICNSEPVLFIRNTVKKAVETYRELREKCAEVALIHGLLSNTDKERALANAKRILQNKRGLIVSTQVVEAGVELGGSILVTDIAPIESLAQRAGRLCRETYGYSEACRSDKAEVLILVDHVAGPYSPEKVNKTLEGIAELLKKGKKIEWRLLEDREDYASFAKIVEKVREEKIEEPIDVPQGAKKHTKTEYRVNVFRHYLESDCSPSELVRLLKELNLELIDRGPLVAVAVPKRKDVLTSLSDVEVVSVDARRIFKHENRLLRSGKECLQYKNNNPLLLIAAYGKRKVMFEVTPAVLEIPKVKVSELSSLELDKLLVPRREAQSAKRISVAEVYLLAKYECYEEGVGLKIWE